MYELVTEHTHLVLEWFAEEARRVEAEAIQHEQALCQRKDEHCDSRHPTWAWIEKSMSDVKKNVKAIIDRLLDDMEITTMDETMQWVNYDRMQFNWQEIKSSYKD